MAIMPRQPNGLLFLYILSLTTTTYSFIQIPSYDAGFYPESKFLLLAKKKKGKKGSESVSSTGIKGFGSAKKKDKKKNDSATSIDRSRETMNFYDFLSQNNAGANLKRVAIGNCPIKLDNGVSSLSSFSFYL